MDYIKEIKYLELKQLLYEYKIAYSKIIHHLLCKFMKDVSCKDYFLLILILIFVIINIINGNYFLINFRKHSLEDILRESYKISIFNNIFKLIILFLFEFESN